MRLGSAKKNREHREKAGAIIFIVGAICVLSFLFYHFYSEKMDSKLPNEPVSFDIVLLDQTSPLHQIQIADAQRKLKAIQDKIPKNGKLIVYVVGDLLKKKLKPIFSKRNPGKPETNEVGYRDNPKLKRKIWLKTFMSPIDSVFKATLDSKSGERQSPIMEGLQALAVTGIPLNTEKKIKIHVFSDMMQNTAEFSQYKLPTVSFEQFKKQNYYNRVRADFQGAKIYLYYIFFSSSEKYQIKEHQWFWKSYFKANKAKVVSFDKIEG